MDSPVSLFHRPEALTAAIDGLSAEGYQVIELDASAWNESGAFHDDVSAGFDFPDYYGRNVNALVDCLRDVVAHDYGWDPASTGLVVVLRHYDFFASADPDLAQAFLDALARASREALSDGGRLTCLVHTDGPDFALAQVGATPGS
ncbi:barstar family protein [Herbiconiux solani]|uniref:barstar family protein n=1 Tax=Herbiconiux solani TaxID=661329 RepID=UPI0009FC6447|nr:barstar family protein [Herbiconiux solani]